MPICNGDMDFEACHMRNSKYTWKNVHVVHDGQVTRVAEYEMAVSRIGMNHATQAAFEKYMLFKV